MLDLQFIRDNRELVETNCDRRGVVVDIAALLALRDRRVELIQQEDTLRHEQKETSATIAKLRGDPAAKQRLIARGKELRGQIGEVESERRAVEERLGDLQTQIPNLSHPDAPVGGEDASRTVRTWGKPPEFGFKPLDHVELAERHDLIDFEAGARVAGAGFYFLKNEAALLELALVQYAARTAVRHGYTLHTTPDLARDEILAGTGYMPRGPETQIYSIRESDMSLVATAEIPLGGALKDQMIEAARLPLRLAGISHCFRTEAGAAGRASRGIYRIHQFTKVELFAFTASEPEASAEMLEEIVAIEEEIFQGLEIPYRVIDTATGDLGGPAYRKFDIEAWMPGRGEYGEVTSASNCTDFQARRLGIRSKTPGRKGTRYVQTLNGTAVAVPRALIAILENFQREDGSIEIPEVLRGWVGVDRIGGTS